MGLNDFVTVPISLSKQPLSRAGFGTPLILGADCPAGFTQRVRTYNTPDDLVTDGFSLSGPTYLMASVLMGQDQAPVNFKVGRLANKPTQKHTLTPVVQNSTEYAGSLNGSRWTYTSDGTATAAEIVAGVHTAIAAVATTLGRSFTFTENATTLDILANAAGQFDSFKVENVDLLGILQTHADPGAAADLAAIEVADSDFYALLNPFNSTAMATAIAAWVETKSGLHQFFCDTNDSNILTVGEGGGAAHIAHVIKAAAYNYSCAQYSPSTGGFLGTALCGLLLPQDPGSENWAMQSPTVEAAALTATHRANLVASLCTFCELLGGQNNTFEGKVGSGQYIDTIRFRAWTQVNIQADVISAVKAQAPKKLAFTDAGIAVIQAAILGVLKRGEKVGGLVENSSSVQVPKLANVSTGDRTARVLSGVSFTAQLAGAINKVLPIKGQLTA